MTTLLDKTEENISIFSEISQGSAVLDTELGISLSSLEK